MIGHGTEASYADCKVKFSCIAASGLITLRWYETQLWSPHWKCAISRIYIRCLEVGWRVTHHFGHVSFDSGLQHEICTAWLGKCSPLQSILFTAWPAGPHLRSSRRSHSVWCLTCNLLICSAWVCFSSWVTRTWTGRKRPLINNLGSYEIFF